MATRDLFFNFIGDRKSLDRAAEGAGKTFGKLEKRVDKISRKMSKFGKGLTAGVTTPIIAAFTLGFDSLAQNEVLMAQTNSVIESMGGAAGKTADEVFDLANEISAMSGLAHENVVEGENMLLTFANITNQLGEGNDIFDQTTRIMADMSVATGQDMKGAALQLGKALNDPIAGLSALTRVGIGFTKAQREQILALVASGDVMGAQKIILGELENQFGGSAAALGDTMTGSINKMTNSFEELARNLAAFLVPIMGTLVGWLQSGLAAFNNLSPAVKKFAGPILLAVAAIGPLLIVGGKLIKAFQAIKAAFIAIQVVMAANPFILLAIAVVAIAFLIFKNWDKIKAFLLAVWEKIKDIFDAAIDFLIKVIKGYLQIYITIWETVVAVVTAAFEFVIGFLKTSWETIVETFKKAIEILVAAFEAFVEFWKGIFRKIVEIVVAAVAGVRETWDKLVAIVRGVLDRVQGAITSVGGAIGRAIQKIIDGWKVRFVRLWSFVTDGFNTLMNFFDELPTRLANATRGLFDGIKNAFRAAVNFVIRAWNNLSLKLGGAKVSLPFGRSFTIPSVTLSTPNIPTIHTGGTFHAPRPGGEGLAVLRDNERILAAGRSELIHVQLVVDSRVLAEALIRHEEALA